MKTPLVLAIAGLMGLGACGVDGPPTRPEPKRETTRGPQISGESYFGYQSGTGMKQGTKINIHYSV